MASGFFLTLYLINMKKNIRLVISYDGTRYFGWEHQPNTDMTIQGKLENVASKMLGYETEAREERTQVCMP